MNPYLYSHLYPLLLSLALLAGLWVCERRSQDHALARGTYLVGAWIGIIGARLWYAAQYGELGIVGGLSIWGFLIAATAGVVGYLRWKLGYWGLKDFPDAAAPAIALGSVLQRVGCFSAGCCFGKLSSLPWAVTFRPDTPVFRHQVMEGLLDPASPRTLPVHPTQLYQSGTMILAFLALLWVSRAFRQRLQSHELFLGLAVYGSAVRFLIEYLRDDAGGRHFGPLTFAQGTSLLVFVAAAALIVRQRLYSGRPVCQAERTA